MPELPDVEILRRYLDATSLHKTIEDVEVRSPTVLETPVRELRSALKGRKLRSAMRHGKNLFARIDGRGWLSLHFGMTGSLKYFKDLEDDPAYDRLLVSFSNGYHLAYVSVRKLGRLSIVGDVDKYIRDKRLGPDALVLDFEGFGRALGRSRASVKAALMNQHLIAGMGNIYSDEILFQSRIRPDRKVGELKVKELEKLLSKMKTVLRTAIEREADPEKLPGTYVIPHRHGDGVCPRCKVPLKTGKFSGRTAYYCPRCQK